MNEKLEIVTMDPDMQWDGDVAIGDVVKIGLKLDPELSDGVLAEWIWTIVTKIEGDRIFATLDNKTTHPYAEYGDHVEFKRENIYSIWC